MFFGDLPIEKKEEFIRILLLQDELEGVEITGIFCDPCEDAQSLSDNQAYILSYCLEDNVCDARCEPRSEVIHDYEPNLRHLKFMTENCGYDYVVGAKKLSKISDEISRYMVAECQQYYANSVQNSRQNVSLDDFASVGFSDNTCSKSVDDFQLFR